MGLSTGMIIALSAVGGAALGTVASSLSSSKQQSQAPAMPTQASQSNTETEAAARQKRLQQMREASAAGKRGGTILTGGQGLGTINPDQTTAKTALGK